MPRELEERLSLLHQEEARLSHLEATTERAHAALQERERRVVARELREGEQETSFVSGGALELQLLGSAEPEIRQEVEELRIIRCLICSLHIPSWNFQLLLPQGPIGQRAPAA